MRISLPVTSEVLLTRPRKQLYVPVFDKKLFSNFDQISLFDTVLNQFINYMSYVYINYMLYVYINIMNSIKTTKFGIDIKVYHYRAN